MSKQKIQLDYSLYVKCPACGDCFDLLSEDNGIYDDDHQLSGPLFHNEWDKAASTVVCPECDCDFKVEGIEY